jgi:hypothetical protein
MPARVFPFASGGTSASISTGGKGSPGQRSPAPGRRSHWVRISSAGKLPSRLALGRFCR